MANRATVLQRLDFLKTGITARPLTKPAMGSFILLAVIALAGMSGLGLAMAAQQDKVPPLVDNAGYYFKANDGLQPPILKNESKAPRAMSGELKEAIRQAVERDGQIMVAVEVYVDETGKVNRQLTRVVTPSTCPAWDKAVLERYFEEEYYPALIDGKPVKYKSTSWLGTGNFARNNK